MIYIICEILNILINIGKYNGIKLNIQLFVQSFYNACDT